MARLYATYIQRGGRFEQLIGPDAPFRQHREAWKNPPQGIERIWQMSSIRAKRVGDVAAPEVIQEVQPPVEALFDLDMFAAEVRDAIQSAGGVHQKITGLKRSTVSKLVSKGFDPEWAKQFFDELAA